MNRIEKSRLLVQLDILHIIKYTAACSKHPPLVADPCLHKCIQL
jgi:hypothetical protein